MNWGMGVARLLVEAHHSATSRRQVLNGKKLSLSAVSGGTRVILYLGGVYGGPEVDGSRVDSALSKIMQLRGRNGREDESGSLDVVFHVPGSIFTPNFVGVWTGRFSKKRKLLQVQVGVPRDLKLQEESQIRLSLLSSLRDAVRIAQPVFAKAGIPFKQDEYQGLLDRIERALSPN
jgi:hypothetical protein